MFDNSWINLSISNFIGAPAVFSFDIEEGIYGDDLLTVNILTRGSIFNSIVGADASLSFEFGGKKEFFNGIVTGYQLKQSANGTSVATLKIKTLCHLLDKETKQAVYCDSGIEEIARSIIGKAGILSVKYMLKSYHGAVKTKIGEWELPKIIIETKEKEGKEKNGKIARDMHFGLKTANGYKHTANFSLDKIRVDSVKEEIEKNLIENEDTLLERFKELVKYTSIFSLETAGLEMVAKMKTLKSTNITDDKDKKPEEYSNKTIVEEVFKHEKTNKFMNEVKNRTIDIIREHGGNINKINSVINDIRKPQYSHILDKAKGLTIAINDTWGHRATITNYAYDIGEIDFRAWFILQHYRGYRPFIHVMEKEILIMRQLLRLDI